MLCLLSEQHAQLFNVRGSVFVSAAWSAMQQLLEGMLKIVKKKFDTKPIALMGVPIMVVVISSRFFVHKIAFLKISFTFISESLVGMIFGPSWTGAGMATAGVIGMLFLLKAGYFPGLTLNAPLAGAIYGYLYCKKEMTRQRVTLAILLTTVLANIILTPLWLNLMYGVNLASPAWWMPRLIKTVIFFPIQVIAAYYLGNRIPFKRLFGKPLSELDQ